MTKTISPAVKPISGAVSLPGDKSVAHRALLFGTISLGTLRLSNMPLGEDVLSTRNAWIF